MIKQLNFTRVKKALQNIENEASYYAGGTLFIDFEDMPCVGLNLNGRGFSYHPNATSNAVRKNFVVTKEMEKMIRNIYIKVKGETDYFKSQVKK